MSSNISNKKEPSKKIPKKSFNEKIKSNRTAFPAKINSRKVSKNIYNEPGKPEIKTKKKKFDEEKFKQQLEFFKQCEKKKQEKIEKLKQDKIKKEIATIKNKENVHYRIKLPSKKLPSLLDRLYTKDLLKRQEKKQILTKIYTPTFTPFLYSKGNPKRYQNRVVEPKPVVSNKNNNNNNFTTYSNTMEDNDISENDYNDENDYEELKYNRAASSKKDEKRAHKVRFKVEEDFKENMINIENNEDEESDEEEKIKKRVVVENALRSKLFNRGKGKKDKLNKSAELRNN